tara:strand:- start:53 stop:307 length:255 start_codon:yes stop_codon:yes gene_type:complete
MAACTASLVSDKDFSVLACFSSGLSGGLPWLVQGTVMPVPFSSRMLWLCNPAIQRLKKPDKGSGFARQRLSAYGFQRKTYHLFD